MPGIKKIFSLEITPEQFLMNCSPLELMEINTLIQGDFFSKRMEAQTCISCGCTDWNCSQCIDKTGEPCYWVEQDLCSACAATTKETKNLDHVAGS